MDIELRGKVDLLSENYNEIRRTLRWDGKLLNHFEALIFSKTDRELNVQAIKEIRKYINTYKNIDNNFKGIFLKIFSVLLNERDDYKEIFDNTVKVYDKLTISGFEKNVKTVFSALILSQRFNEQELDNRVNRLINIRNRLNKHDYLNYANLAATNKNIDIIIDEILIVRNNIREAGVILENEIDAFATALIIDGNDINSKIEKALSISCNIKSELFPLPKSAFPLLGLASLLVEDADTFARELKEVFDMISILKRYKYFMSNELKLIISIVVLLNKYTEEIKAELIDVNLTDEINVLLALEEYTVFSLALF